MKLNRLKTAMRPIMGTATTATKMMATAITATNHTVAVLKMQNKLHFLINKYQKIICFIFWLLAAAENLVIAPKNCSVRLSRGGLQPFQSSWLVRLCLSCWYYLRKKTLGLAQKTKPERPALLIHACSNGAITKYVFRLLQYESDNKLNVQIPL